jgi:hypothetical protein
MQSSISATGGTAGLDDHWYGVRQWLAGRRYYEKNL